MIKLTGLNKEVCAAVALMMFAGVAFIQDTKKFSSAPKEFRKALTKLKPRY